MPLDSACSSTTPLSLACSITRCVSHAPQLRDAGVPLLTHSLAHLQPAAAEEAHEEKRVGTREAEGDAPGVGLGVRVRVGVRARVKVNAWQGHAPLGRQRLTQAEGEEEAHGRAECAGGEVGQLLALTLTPLTLTLTLTLTRAHVAQLAPKQGRHRIAQPHAGCDAGVDYGEGGGAAPVEVGEGRGEGEPEQRHL
eukprot:scaffold11665_cov60-Phaeocystis_antarctica.AAC.3